MAYLVDVFDLVVGEFLEFGFSTMEVVLGDLVVALQAADMVMAVAADVAYGDAGVLNAFSYLLGYFASTLLCELGDCQADDGAVVAGIEADVRFEDGLFDGADGAAIPGLNDDEAGLRGTDGGGLVEGWWGAL